jgi:hypothetical protein
MRTEVDRTCPRISARGLTTPPLAFRPTIRTPGILTKDAMPRATREWASVQAFQKRRVAPFGQPVDVLVRPDYEDDAQPVIVENRVYRPIRTTAPGTEFQGTGATQAASKGMTCKGIVPKAKDLPHRAIMIVAEILDVLRTGHSSSRLTPSSRAKS